MLYFLLVIFSGISAYYGDHAEIVHRAQDISWFNALIVTYRKGEVKNKMEVKRKYDLFYFS